MSKNKKNLLVIVTGIIALVLTGFLFVMSIRSEFKTYLSKEYPEQKFDVGYVKIDPIYGSYYSSVTCLDDSIPFGISKSFNTKKISEYYSQAKSTNQYNAKIRAIFNGSGIKSAIINVSGGSRSPFQNDGLYSQISLLITENVNLISVTKKTIAILRENNITAERLDLTQGKDKHVYEITLSPADCGLTESELETKVEQRK